MENAYTQLETRCTVVMFKLHVDKGFKQARISINAVEAQRMHMTYSGINDTCKLQLCPCLKLEA